MNITEKLLKVQSGLKAPKNQYNKFGGYSYRSCEDILEAVKPLCAEVGAAIIVGDEIQAIGTRYYVKATAEFLDTESGESISNTAYAREEETKKGMDSSQITGSASSYARKYALNGLLCIDDTKDADTMDNTGNSGSTAKNTSSKQAGQQKSNSTRQSGGQQQAQQQQTQPQNEDPNAKIDAIKIATLNGTLQKKNVSPASMLGFYKVKAVEELTVSQFIDAMKKLEPMPDVK